MRDNMLTGEGGGKKDGGEANSYDGETAKSFITHSILSYIGYLCPPNTITARKRGGRDAKGMRPPAVLLPV
jgi:hypothetical protein